MIIRYVSIAIFSNCLFLIKQLRMHLHIYDIGNNFQPTVQYMYILYYSTDVAWFRGPTLLEDNADNVEIWRQRDRHFLRLYDIQNSSFYSCTALNTLGEVTHHFRLGLKKGKKTKIVCHICLQYVICRKKMCKQN